MNKRTIIILAFTILLISGFASAQDERLPLSPPPGYYGSITVNGQPAAAGTTIIAKIGGEERGSITTVKSGFYGDDPGPAKLWIKSYQNEPGSTVTFYVSDVAAQQTAKLPGAGIINRADLTFVGVPVPTLTEVSGSSTGGSTSGSTSGNTAGSSGGGSLNTTTTSGLNRSGITPEVTEAPSKASQALSEAPPSATLAINPAIIIGLVILLVSMVIAVPYFKRKKL